MKTDIWQENYEGFKREKQLSPHLYYYDLLPKNCTS